MTIKHLIATVLIATTFTSCDKYLDLQPQDKFLDDQVYSSRSSIQSALNGVYLNMAKSSLYGGNMSCLALDAMAQYYNCGNSAHQLNSIAGYKYLDERSQTIFGDTWSAAYAAVLNLNLFIQKVTNISENIVPAAERDLMLGEAYGLRAYLLFDMLRLFGPVYRIDSTSLSIPYPQEAVSATPALLPANAVIALVLEDIRTATTLLSNDPVRKEGVVPSGTDIDNFLKDRNRRMNYFALNGLEARVQLYAGNKAAALQMARAVIQDAEKWFPWTDAGSFGTQPDRVFSSEIIFASENINLYNTYDSYFAVSNSLNRSLLIPFYNTDDDVNRLLDIYEKQENDTRYKYWWEVNRSSTMLYRTFFKYMQTGTTDRNRYLQPLMRLSEMYLIAAECEPDVPSATAWLNMLQFNRGLHDLPPGYDLRAELTKAYRKEFWGEGQLFFYYKRINQRTLLSGSSTNEIAMGATRYQVPLPLIETQFR